MVMAVPISVLLRMVLNAWRVILKNPHAKPYVVMG